MVCLQKGRAAENVYRNKRLTKSGFICFKKSGWKREYLIWLIIFVGCYFAENTLTMKTLTTLNYQV